jgi:hypothetical protein
VFGLQHFFVGVHHPHNAAKVERAFISYHALKRRRSAFPVLVWIMDSGSFTTILKFGGYPEEPEVYGAAIRQWSTNGELLAAVTQDYMCEPHMLTITGMTVADHQRLTIERFDRLSACDLGGTYLMPVLQGYDPGEYVEHLAQYGERLPPGAWIGVGSVCKRNGDPAAIEAVLLAIKRRRPDLRLHGFGLKKTALGSGLVRSLLFSADSMAWSYAARREGRDANDIKEAIAYQRAIERMPVQGDFTAAMELGA